MIKYLIMSIGTGKDVEYGLAKSIKNSHPDHIILLISKTSEDTVERLKPIIPEYKDKIRLAGIRNEDDVEKCMQDSLEAINDVIKEGGDKNYVSVDFTSGTKAMTAGLAIAALLAEVGEMVYVVGDREQVTGRVIKGTERVLVLAPNELIIEKKKKEMMILFNEGLYERGISVCNKILELCQKQTIVEEINNWKFLFEAYMHWDRFNHIEAANVMAKISKDFINKLRIDLSSNKEIVNKIGKNLQKMADASIKLSHKYSNELIGDLLANARRRYEEGKYDDAVARLYRVTEMVAQKALAEKGIDTSCIKREDIPEEIAHEFNYFHSSRQNISAIGLDKSFRLLESKGDKNAKVYLENNKLRNALKFRNESILAHGTKPIEKEIYRNLEKQVIDLINLYIDDIETYIKKSTFPMIY